MKSMDEMLKMILLGCVLGIILSFGFDIVAGGQTPAKTCTVDKVFDGDNVSCIVRIGRYTERRNLRIAAIDAPEIRGGQGYNKESRDNLRSLVLDKTVTIEVRGFETKWKRYLVRVLIDDKDAGLEQVRAGAAWYRPIYAKSLTADQRTEYQAAMNEAKAEKRGLWASRAIAPWRFRAGDR